jgi:cholesterol transport system auxiliary component
VLAAAALAGCTGSLFQSKAVPSSVYLLSAGAAHAGERSAGAAIPADLAVLRPRVRKGLDTDRIAVLYPDRRLDYFADARWSGPLDEMFQDVAVQVFRDEAGLRNVSADASAFASAYWMEIEIIDFQAEYAAAAGAPVIHVQLMARLGGAGDRRVLGSFAANARQPASDNRLTAIVEAFDLAVNAALADVVSRSVAALGGEHR